MHMSKDTIRQVTVIVALIATIVINGLANALPLNNQTTGEISDQFTVYFVPAGYVFSIWGLIYLALAAFAVYQALPAQREDPALRGIGYLFAASCAANIAWLFFWHYNQYPLTLLAMLVLLGLLIVIYLRLNIGSRVSTTRQWLVHIPFSIYLGWITVATIANVTSLLDWLGWNGWGLDEATWAAIMLVAATGITTVMSLTRGDVAYGLVVVWAFAGIAVKHADTPLVANTAWITLGIIVVMLVIGALLRRRRA